MGVLKWMKRVIFSDHAEKRRRQRGFTSIEIEFVIERPQYKKKRLDGRIEVFGVVKSRQIKVIYEEKESYLKIVSIM